MEDLLQVWNLSIFSKLMCIGIGAILLCIWMGLLWGFTGFTIGVHPEALYSILAFGGVIAVIIGALAEYS